ncbi:GNAT family N-acetyltransferase [Paenibacillus sp. HN-1]|uniref:GNAT family N-acetyltransferase n=1 Tax=Paenibacillus TaxID=44249 RepID=UPI001CA8CD3F|nr:MULTISPECIES: GNAT family N-acetyltransferase [Paenibacillus]MBY9078056.1 GNAT family N-acetyltransferase [Paenibacillus sp. CGMCC 1.18879]MBY9083797.1 GNAT family N-acetyltransferase [Paenibacillus sinensis]
MKIEYVVTDLTSLALIQPLWERLRDHHASLSDHFSEQLSRNTFEARSRDLLDKSKQGQLKIIIAHDTDTKMAVGYCISSINEARQGEIDSIYLLDAYRGEGIGDTLMRETLDWFQDNGIRDIGISVLYGNEQVLRFYAKYGFYPRAYLLKNGSDKKE